MSQFAIEILDVSQPKNESKNGRAWSVVELAYKRLPEGKVEGRKVLSFQKDIYDVLVKAQKGEQFTVETVKNDKTGYWDWVKASLGAKEIPAVSEKAATGKVWEDPSKRQSSIERQNALTNAVAFSGFSKKTPTVNETLS